MRRKDFLTYLLLGALLAAAVTFIWNYKTTIPWITERISPALLPVFGGVCIGFIMNLPASFFEKHIKRCRIECLSKHSMGLALLISILLLLVFIALVFTLVIPELVNAISLFAASLRDFASNSNFWNETDISRIPVLNTFFDGADDGILTIADALEQKINEFTPSIISYTFSTIQGMISSVVVFFVSFIFAVYFISIAFSRFITAQVTEALIIGVLCFAGMLILGFPYALTVGILTGVMALLPIYGALIGALVGAFMIAVIAPWKGLFFLIFIIVLQQLEGNLIYPRVVGTTTGVPSVYVFIAVTIGGALFGILGMLLAVPVFSIIFTLLKEKSDQRSKIKIDAVIDDDKRN